MSDNISETNRGLEEGHGKESLCGSSPNGLIQGI